jgi:YfiH family protein
MISSRDMVAATAMDLETAHEAAPAQMSWLAAPKTSRLLRSRLLTQLGVRHGFTTRLGGVSSGRFASLNLGQTWGDDLACASENLRLVAQDAGFETQRLCQVQQVHGKLVLPLSQPERRVRQADGMATADALVLGVLSADCVSILLADELGRVAAVHAGWRGTVAGIAQEAVEALTTLGAARSSLRAAMAPSIGPCCFEVQADVAEPFAQVAPASVQCRDGRLFVDLWHANRQWLLAAGLRPDHIDDRPPCTCCDEQRYFSYRRDGAGIGQHLAFICGGNQ